MEIMTITAGVIMSLYMNAAQNNESDYCYNADIENNHVVAQYVYNRFTVPNGNSECVVLKPKLKHHYDYDTEGRLLVRTTSNWNGSEWQPTDKLEYKYTPTGYSVALSHWDMLRQHFTQPVATTVYNDTSGL